MRSYNWNTLLIKPQLILIGCALVLILSTGGCRCNKEGRKQKSEGGVLGGIPNIGNTCYMNSVLQIFKTLYPDSFEDALNNNQDDPIAQAGQALIDVIKDDQKTASKEEAEAFLAAIEIKKDSLGLGWEDGRSQQDAQELLGALFDKLNFPRAAVHEFLINQNTNEIRKSGSADHWSMLQVTLSGDSEEPMQNLLDNYLGEEDITDYKWNETDRKPTSVTKKKQLNNLNNLENGILPIHAKRFGTIGGKAVTSDSQGETSSKPYSDYKITKRITKPFSITAKYGANKDISFTLVAFIEHRGSTSRGHYVTYAKKGGQWTLYNDSNVTQVTAQEAEKAAEQAYLYFYKLAF